MRLDHLAFRVFDRDDFQRIMSWLGYHIVQDFTLFDGDVRSYALKGPGPEVFVSEGRYGSIVGDWVSESGGGLHHIAFETSNIEQTADDLPFEFGEILDCGCPEPLLQCFSRETEWGFIVELITKNGHPGFCRGNVERLMEQSRAR